MRCVQHDINSPAKTGVGTPVYMAPEIILGGKFYDAKVKLELLSRACHQQFAIISVLCCALEPVAAAR